VGTPRKHPARVILGASCDALVRSEEYERAMTGEGWSHTFRPGAKGTAEFTEKNFPEVIIFFRLLFFSAFCVSQSHGLYRDKRLFNGWQT